MKSKFFFLLLGVILTLALTACGSTSAPTETPAAEPAAAEEPAAEPAPAEEAPAEPVPAGTASVSIDGNTVTITGTEGGETETSNGITKTPVVKCSNVGYTVQAGPMTLTVNKFMTASVRIDDENTAAVAGVPAGQEVSMVVMDMTAENTSGDTITFYPDQGTIVTDTKEQTTAALFVGDDVGGDFYGQVVKSGQVFWFLPNSKAEDIHHVQLRIDSPHDENYDHFGDTILVEFELIK